MAGPTGKTVLVVDDDASLRSAITGVLERLGHTVVRAPDGIWALRTLETQPIDLIIMDVSMPRKDGLEALQEIRGGKHKKLPVVMVTARAGDRDVLKGYEAGADYYLTKPFKPAQLVKIVEYLIGDLPGGRGQKLAEKL